MHAENHQQTRSKLKKIDSRKIDRFKLGMFLSLVFRTRSENRRIRRVISSMAPFVLRGFFYQSTQLPTMVVFLPNLGWTRHTSVGFIAFLLGNKLQESHTAVGQQIETLAPKAGSRPYLP